jgi:hypothetical protein
VAEAHMGSSAALLGPKPGFRQFSKRRLHFSEEAVSVIPGVEK